MKRRGIVPAVIICAAALTLTGCSRIIAGHPARAAAAPLDQITAPEALPTSQGPTSETAVATASPDSAAPEPGVASFLCQWPGLDILVQWQSAQGSIDGTFREAQLAGQPPDEQTKTTDGPVSGSITGGSVQIAFGAGQPLYGTVMGTGLTLNWPQQDGSLAAASCAQASTDDWNGALAALGAQAASDDNAAEAQQSEQVAASTAAADQQTIAQDVPDLQAASTVLNDDKSLGADLKKMRADYATEVASWKREQGLTCDAAGSAADDVGTDDDNVGSDGDTLGSDIDALQSGPIATIQNDIADINQAADALQSLGVQSTTPYQKAVSDGSGALASATTAINWANGQATSIQSAADKLSRTASDYATTRCN